MSRKRQSVHPDTISLDLGRIADDCRKIISPEYRAAWEYSHDRRDRTSHHVDEKNRGQEKVSGGGETPDPVGLIVVSQEWASREVREVAGLIDKLGKQVSTIKGRLAGIFTDPDEEYEPLRRQPILSTAQTTQKQRGEAFQRKRELQEAEKRLAQQLIQERRDFRENVETKLLNELERVRKQLEDA